MDRDEIPCVLNHNNILNIMIIKLLKFKHQFILFVFVSNTPNSHFSPLPVRMKS